MNKLLRFLVVAWVLVAGLTACRDYDFDLWQNNDASGDNAYMSFSFAIAGEKTVPTRAAAGGFEPPEDAPDFGPYSFTWEEEGGDPINKVVAYVFYEKDGAFVYETTKEFSASDLQSDNGAWRLKEPFNTTAGKKKVFVVVNPTASVKANINAKLTRVSDDTPSEYEEFDKFNEYLHSSEVHTFTTDNYPTSHVPQSRADELVTNGGILMTGEAVETTIQAGVEKATVQSTAANNPKITVERAAARVLVTMPEEVDVSGPQNIRTKADYDKINDNQIIKGDQRLPIAYVTDITWRVAQGAKDFYFIKKSAPNQKFILTSYYNPNWEMGKDYKDHAETAPAPDTLHVSLPTEEMPNPPVALPEYDASGKPITDIWNEVYPEYFQYTNSFDYSGLWKAPKRPVERAKIDDPTGNESGELNKLKPKDLPENPYSDMEEEDLNEEQKRERDRIIKVRDSLIIINKDLANKRKEYAEKTYIKREKDVLKTVQNGYEYVLPTSPGFSQYANNAYVIIRAKIIPLVWQEPGENDPHSAYKKDDNNATVANPDYQPFTYDAEGGFYFQPGLNLGSFSKEPIPDVVNIYFKGGYAYWCVPINPNNRYRRLRNGGIDETTGTPIEEQPEAPANWGVDCAPIMRNAYYHLQIGYFRRMGMNWNPFVPYPEEVVIPQSNNPHNPDPRPKKDPNHRLPAFLPNDALKNNIFKQLREGGSDEPDDPNIYAIEGRKWVFYKGGHDYTYWALTRLRRGRGIG